MSSSHNSLTSSKSAKISTNESQSLSNKNPPIDILCYDLSGLSKSLQFIVLTLLTFVFFLLYGYLQELLYQLPGFSDFSWFLTLVQFFFYSCFAFFEAIIRNDLKRKWVYLSLIIINLIKKVSNYIWITIFTKFMKEFKWNRISF